MAATPPPGTYGRQAFIARQAQGFPAGPVNYGNDGKSTLANAEGYAYELIKAGDKNADRALTAEEWAPQFGGDLNKAQRYLAAFDANANGTLDGAEAMLMTYIADNPVSSLFQGSYHLLGHQNMDSAETSKAKDDANPRLAQLNIEMFGLLEARKLAGENQHAHDGVITIEEQAQLDDFVLNAGDALKADVKDKLEIATREGINLHQRVAEHFAIYDQFPVNSTAAPKEVNATNTEVPAFPTNEETAGVSRQLGKQALGQFRNPQLAMQANQLFNEVADAINKGDHIHNEAFNVKILQLDQLIKSDGGPLPATGTKSFLMPLMLRLLRLEERQDRGAGYQLPTGQDGIYDDLSIAIKQKEADNAILKGQPAVLPLTSGFSTTAVPQNYMQALTMMALLAVLTSLMGNPASQTQPSIQF